MAKYWKRILIAGFATEILYGVYIFLILGSAQEAYAFAGLLGAFGFFVVGGIWGAWKADSNRAPQGALVAVVAVVFYTLLTVPAIIGGSYVFTGMVLLNHVLKIAGGAAGGFLAGTPMLQKR
jgi:hypothetical protein